VQKYDDSWHPSCIDKDARGLLIGFIPGFLFIFLVRSGKIIDAPFMDGLMRLNGKTWIIISIVSATLLTGCGLLVGAADDEVASAAPLDVSAVEPQPPEAVIIPDQTESVAVSGSAREAIIDAPPLPVQIPTALPAPDFGWRPPPYPPPWALTPWDHFFLGRPIPSNEVNWPNSQYRYGSTLLGLEDLHTGIDIGAARHTKVVAAGPGEVVWAGYGLYRGVEDRSDPYVIAVVIRHDFGYKNQQLYSVYAHLGSVTVMRGQRVEMGDELGAVGETGHASGPHLHFEVRLGDNRYFNTRNPELWIVPPEGWGVLAGRLENTYGRLLLEQLLQITSLETGQRWNVWSYADEATLHPDSYYNENFAISDLPAGPYEVQINFAGRAYTAQFYLEPGLVNYIEFHGRNGFDVSATPSPVE
jgi:murein DD-endopeptidase MepM/ murein hydrolase activator NlpD